MAHYGYTDSRKKYKSLEPQYHNNGDKTPNTSLWEHNGSYVLKDFAGQKQTYDVFDVIKHKEGIERFPDAVRFAAQLCGIEIDKGSQQRVSKLQFFLEHNCIRYDYHRIDNLQYDCTKWRKPDKKFEWGIYKGSEYIPSRKENPISRHTLSIFCNGRIKELKNAIANGTLICYPEGEKDVITLWKNGYVSFSFGGTKTFKDEILPYLKGGNFLVFADNDEKGIEDAENIMRKLNMVGVAKMIIPSDTPKGDISDYMREHTKEELQKLVNATVSQETITEKTPRGNSLQDTEPVQKASGELMPTKSMQTTAITPKDTVISLLAYKENSKGENKIIQSVRNFEIVFESDVRFIGRIRFNEFSQQTYLIGNTAWENRNNYRPWSSFDDSAAFSILQSDYGLNSRNDYFDAIKNVSMRNKFHPVRELLDSLKWDKREHIRNFLTDYIGVEDSEYSYQVFKLWLLGGVSRIFQPGIKFDYVIVLKGPQGIGKSTILTLLAINEEWFNDSLDSLDSDKSAQSLMGSWIIELAELKSLARTAGGVDSVKRFLSATQDKYRIPYERRADIFQRQCVFAGTTNRDDFLQDETGNRRFLILEAGVNAPKKDLFSDDVMEEVKQVWAEAVHIYKNEHPKLVLPDGVKKKAEEMQADSMADDGKVGLITEYLADKSRVCAIEVWQKALNEQGRPQKWQASEINSIILGLPGWKKMSSPAKFGEYGSQRGFQKVCSKNANDCINVTRDCSNEFIQITDEMLSELPFD